MNTIEAFLLLGPTGSGKTPLGQRFEEDNLLGYPCVHFDFGENLRSIVERGAPDRIVSRADIEFLRHVLSTGALLEDKDFPIAERILRSFLQQHVVESTSRVVLNGLPRHVGQAEALNRLLHVELVIWLSCEPEVVLARVSADTGGDRRGRSDDDLALVRRKLDIFAQRTAPLIDHYREQNARVIRLEITPFMTTREMHREVVRRFIQPAAGGDKL